MIDNNLQNELRNRYNPEGSSVRRMQMRMLEMLRFLDKVCQDNNIVYWLDSGTLLGAQRHGGFIPWDDDVDVCMPKEHLKKFEKIMMDNNPSKEFVIQNHKTDAGYYSSWSVLRDLKSEYVQNSNLHNRRKYRGLQIDIFQVEDRKNIFIYKIAKRLQYYLVDKRLFSNIQANVDNAYKFLYKFIFPIFNLITKLKKTSYYLYNYGTIFSPVKMYKKDIFPLTKIEFEGYEFNSPNNVDGYLREIYGDWTDIPSHDKIKTHNVKVIFKTNN